MTAGAALDSIVELRHFEDERASDVMAWLYHPPPQKQIEAQGLYINLKGLITNLSPAISASIELAWVLGMSTPDAKTRRVLMVCGGLGLRDP